MIVIVASRWDSTAKDCAARWAAHVARVLTAQDLSVTGWRQRLNRVSGDSAIVDAEVVSQEQIAGVITRLPSISAEELVDITPPDRSYVAAEMTAFLLFWLSRLKCPVLNRPTPTCLSGPHWRREKWVYVAAQAGIAVEPVRRLAAFGSSGAEEQAAAAVAVTVIGPRTFGDADPVLHRHARLLAGLARVEFVRVLFSGPDGDARLVGVDTFPSLTDDGVADRVLEYIGGEVADRA